MSKISLETLLTPKSIAVVGASPKAGTVGNEAILNLQKGGYKGDLFFVNPRYDELFENVCFDNLHSLPKKPEHVIFAVNDTRCLLYTSPSPRDRQKSRMPSSA